MFPNECPPSWEPGPFQGGEALGGWEDGSVGSQLAHPLPRLGPRKTPEPQSVRPEGGMMPSCWAEHLRSCAKCLVSAGPEEHPEWSASPPTGARLSPPATPSPTSPNPSQDLLLILPLSYVDQALDVPSCRILTDMDAIGMITSIFQVSTLRPELTPSVLASWCAARGPAGPRLTRPRDPRARRWEITRGEAGLDSSLQILRW